MSRISVTCIQADGERKILDVEVGKTLMEVARDNGVAGILADCGGCCDCGTCHVYVDERWCDIVGPPNDVEIGTLDLMVANGVEGKSRLACQVELRPEMDGLIVTVATDL